MNLTNEQIAEKFYTYIIQPKVIQKIRVSKYKQFQSNLNKLMDEEYYTVAAKLVENIILKGWNKSSCEESDFYNYFHSSFKNHCINYVKKKETIYTVVKDNFSNIDISENISDLEYKEQLEILKDEVLKLVLSNKLNNVDIKYLSYYLKHLFFNIKLKDIALTENVKVSFIKNIFTIIENTIKTLLKDNNKLNQ
jgi:DNA-directed RNA polymerase specialized sigma24 family protein